MIRRPFSLLAATLLTACGSSPAPVVTTPRPQPAVASANASEAPTAADRVETVTISGLTGSLSNAEAHHAIDPRMSDFAECFVEHGRRLRQLGGAVSLHFRVGVDGRVQEAHPVDSTVGHRAVERCLSEVAMTVHFPRPRGGEATLSWPIMMDPPEGVAEPTIWDPDRVAGVVERRSADVLEECRPEGSAAQVQVTAYVRAGRIVAAGAAVEDESAVEMLDCVVERVRRWPMPSNPRLAKVTFNLVQSAS